MPALADNVARAVEGAKLYSDLSRRASQLAVVTEVGRSITSILDLRQMMEVVARLLHRPRTGAVRPMVQEGDGGIQGPVGGQAGRGSKRHGATWWLECGSS